MIRASCSSAEFCSDCSNEVALTTSNNFATVSLCTNKGGGGGEEGQEEGRGRRRRRGREEEEEGEEEAGASGRGAKKLIRGLHLVVHPTTDLKAGGGSQGVLCEGPLHNAGSDKQVMEGYFEGAARDTPMSWAFPLKQLQ